MEAMRAVTPSGSMGNIADIFQTLGPDNPMCPAHRPKIIIATPTALGDDDHLHRSEGQEPKTFRSQAKVREG